MAYFSDTTIKDVWNKAQKIASYNPDIWRKDFAGAWINIDQYGEQSKYGWEIDHLMPVSLGGSDDFSNLVPLHWKNNRCKSNNYPEFETEVTSENNTNVYSRKSWIIRTE